MYDNHAIMLTANVNINMKETVCFYLLVLKAQKATGFSTWPERKANFESQPLTSNPSRKLSPERTHGIK